MERHDGARPTTQRLVSCSGGPLGTRPEISEDRGMMTSLASARADPAATTTARARTKEERTVHDIRALRGTGR